MKVLSMIMAWCARLFRGRKSKEPNWNEIEYFNESWKNRIKAMSVYITENSSVIDLGSGKEWLKDFLPSNVKYIAVDYMDRGTANLICDFNRDQFPTVKGDFAFISGCLEYIVDYNSFIENVSQAVTTVIVSYNTMELVSDLAERKSLAWKNHLSEKELISLFASKNMELTKSDRAIPKNPIFIFNKLK